MKALALGTTVYIDPSQCDAPTREELGGAITGTTGYPRGGDKVMVWIGGIGRERTVTVPVAACSTQPPQGSLFGEGGE